MDHDSQPMLYFQLSLVGHEFAVEPSCLSVGLQLLVSLAAEAQIMYYSLDFLGKQQGGIMDHQVHF